MHGREARLPIDVLLQRNEELPEGIRDFHDHLVQSLNTVYEKVYHNPEYKQWLMSQNSGSQPPLPAYPVGSLVMHYTPNLMKGQTAMETVTWTGPHQVIEVTNGGLTYTVNENGKPVRLHVGRLKAYVDGTKLGAALPSVPEDDEDSVEETKEGSGGNELPEGVFEVEEIISRHMLTRRSRVKPKEAQSIVCWKGYTAEDDTVESVDNLVSCARKVAEFWRSHPRLHLDDATPAELDFIAIGEAELKSGKEAKDLSHEGVASK